MADQNDSEARRRSTRCLYPAPSKHGTEYRTGPFTIEEKEQMLSALYTFGPNVDKLTPLLPSRSKEQVRDFLTSWFRRVRKVPVVFNEKDYQTQLIKEPIEAWLNKIKKEIKSCGSGSDGSLPFPWYPYALGYIAKYENHPSPAETGGVDFKKLYEYLGMMLHGNTPNDLGFMDALFMLSSLRKLKLRLEKVDFHKDEVHIKRTSSSQSSAGQPRTYKRMKKENTEENTRKSELETFLSSTMANPLKMPIELLSIKERLKN